MFVTVWNILSFLIITLIANGYLLVQHNTKCLFAFIPLLFILCLLTGFVQLRSKSIRLRICYHGLTMLRIFVFSAILSTAYHIVLLFILLPQRFMMLIWSVVFCICVEAIVFWTGIICVYATSVQLGIKYRVIGALCGMIPIVNLIILKKIIFIVRDEVDFEYKKELVDRSREQDKLCQTKYPILLVHGVFFRDNKHFNYWGRIPKALKTNGAQVYYGEHQSARPVCDSAVELTKRIKQIIRETGCEKVNVIAHSKGGLDCRYAISELDMAPYIASLTTVNTPHRGCGFADFLLEKLPQDIKDRVADTYNKTLKRLGDENPDFIAAVSDLTEAACKERNEKLKCMPDEIFCQSVGSKMNKAKNGKFPLNFSYHLVKLFDGDNDGLVSESSFEWGSEYTYVTVTGERGVSHGDMIDLNRENIKEFDVREFYVQLVNDLKKRGL
ncbi:MAG: triacylglycerol lipase [Clostridia bacterium]|nr:triacylglycerol lipase [Clostridia bacterium]